MYKHYSFDLWLTLIKSNPIFKEKRARYFFENYNFKKKSFEEIAQVFKIIDVMCNSINESTGKNIDSDEMYLMVLSNINDYELDLTKIDNTLLYNDIEDLVFQYQPILYSHETKIVLDQLKSKNDKTLSILSNTAFIKGKTLRIVLDNLGLSSYFDFQLYSDEVGFSKPNKAFFELMLQNIFFYRNNCNLALNKIIHIGDNPVADYKGAKSIGIDSKLINSNSNPITSILYL